MLRVCQFLSFSSVMLVEDLVVVFRVLGSDRGICAHGIMIVKWW